MPRKQVIEFADSMESKLKENDHKSGWGNLTSSYLLLRLREEVDELEHAIRSGKSSKEVISEAADVANFSMMLADNARYGRLHN